MNLRHTVLQAILLVVAASTTGAAIDFEGSVPAGWSESGGGTLGISSDHYRLGSESLHWSWQGGDVLTAAGVSIDPAKVLDFYQHTCDLWIYSDTVTAGDVLTVEFLDGAAAVQWRFEVRLNFSGWRHLLRSYKYDMEKVGGGTDLQTVRFIAPAGGSGNLYFDDLEWVRSRLTRRRDRVMPDVGGYYSDSLHHTLENVVPDLPPAPATAAELAALTQVRSEFWASTAASNPSSSAVAAAKSSFATWNIVRSGGGIKGKPVHRDNLDEINGFIAVLAREWIHDGDTEARDMVLDLVDHLLDQGIAGGSAEAAERGSGAYGTRELVRALLLLRDDYPAGVKAQVEDLLQWRLKRGLFWDPNIATNKNTDFMHTESMGLMGLVLGFSDTDQETVEGLRGLRQYFERFIAFSPGTVGGIKPDGTGFHHWTHYNHYMYALATLAERLHVLRDTPFLVDQASYECLRDACYVMALMSNDTNFAGGLSGRFPLSGNFPVSSGTVAKLAKTGGPFFGEAADPKLARFHNRVWGNDAALLAYGSEDFPAGFWQFNYSPMGLYRTGDAVVTIKGLTDTFWGTEIYSTANRYGRYQGYGTVEVMYPGGRAASGFDLNGWDWNSPPGATTIRLPAADLEAEKSRQDEVAQTRFCGALGIDLDPDGEFGVKGRLGLFGLKFRQAALSTTHNPTFTFRKSVFATDGLLVCLGSDIANDDAVNETTTVLFQGKLPTTATATNRLGTDLTAFPQSWTWGGGAQWLLDHLGTGYYLPAGQSVRLARQAQSSPPQSGSGANTTGNFAKAWIEHGTAPAGADYEYVVKPGTDVTGMQQLATEINGSTPPYTVLRKDGNAHIVDLHRDGTRAYVCFEAVAAVGHGPVLSTSAPALLATRGSATYLVLSYANPELDLAFREEGPAGVVTTDVRLDGEWSVDSGDPRATLLPQGDGTTVVRFATEHGLPVEQGLVQVTSFADWQAEHFTPSQLADPAISGYGADPERDGLANGLEYSLLLDPWQVDRLSDGFDVILDGGTLTAEFRRDRSRPGVGLVIEQSTNLATWSPLPAVLVDDTLGVETWQAVTVPGAEQRFLRLSATLVE